MNNFLWATDVFSDRATNDQMKERLRHTLAGKYMEVFSHAQAHWERHFAGKDPSDACVSVRISPAGRAAQLRGRPPALSGVLRSRCFGV